MKWIRRCLLAAIGLLGLLLTYWEIAAPEYAPYLGRLIDLSGLIRLVNLKYEIRKNHIDSNHMVEFLASQGPELRDPYTDKPISWDAQKQTIYFNGTDKRARFSALAVPDLLP